MPAHGGHGAEEDADRVAPADRVAELAEVVAERLVVQLLDQTHALQKRWVEKCDQALVTSYL